VKRRRPAIADREASRHARNPHVEIVLPHQAVEDVGDVAAVDAARRTLPGDVETNLAARDTLVRHEIDGHVHGVVATYQHTRNVVGAAVLGIVGPANVQLRATRVAREARAHGFDLRFRPLDVALEVVPLSRSQHQLRQGVELFRKSRELVGGSAHQGGPIHQYLRSGSFAPGSIPTPGGVCGIRRRAAFGCPGLRASRVFVRADRIQRVEYAARVEPADLASVDWVLRTTRSVRRRLDFDRPVPAEVIEECIDVATQAPTGIAAENWRFLVLTSPERKLAIAELYRRALDRMVEARGEPAKTTQRALAERIHEVPALILVCAEGRPPLTSSPMQVGFYGSILPAAWSLMLALRARGLGSTWTSLHLLYESEAAEALGIPDGVTQTVLLPVAYTKDAVLKPARRKPAREVTFWDHWGATRS